MPARYPIEKAQAIIAQGLPIGPRLYPCVCGEGRHAHKGANGTGACKTTECKRYRANLAWELAYAAIDAEAASLGKSLTAADKAERAAHYKANPRKPGEWSIGASDAGTCPRALYYRNTPPEDYRPAWSDTREARAGTMLHNEITRKMQMLYAWRMFQTKVRIPGLDRDSELDSYDPVTGLLDDYKTAGEWKWEMIGNGGPTEETWDQLYLYGYALVAAGYEVKTVRLLYYRRANGHDEEFTRPYDAERAQQALDRLLGYAQNLDAIADGMHLDADGNVDHAMLDELMPRTGAGPNRDPLCKRCPARNHCWNIPAAEQAGRSPYSYTVLGPDPEEPVIIWTLQDLMDARKELKDAKDREAEVKDRLDGVEVKRYGPYEGWTQNGALRDDTKGYVEKLRAAYLLPEELRPPLDAIEMDKKRDRASVRWGNVRKATLEREKREQAQLDKDAAAAVEARAEAAAPPLRDDEQADTAEGEVA